MDKQPLKIEDEQKKHFLITGFYALSIIALILFLCNYAMTTLLPFLIAWCTAAVLHPLFGLLKKKVRFSCKLIGVALTIIFYLLIAFLGIILCDRLLDAAVSFLTSVPRLWNDTLMPFLQAAGEKITELLAHFNVEMNVSFNELLSSAGKTIISYSTQLLGKVGNVAISIPGLLVDAIICIVSTIFILLDWEIIRDFIYRQLSQKTTKVISHASQQLGRTLRQYILSYGFIVLMTFTEISIGLWLTGIQNALLIGALIALIDILPIVGSGAILLPWCIISFACGNVHNGICILLLYIVVTIVRNIVEPKVVGKQVGLHPLVTLLAMVIGASAFGGVGVLVLPVAIAVAKKLNDDHVIDIIKEEQEADSIRANPNTETANVKTVAHDSEKTPRNSQKWPC